jgi:hypothetical protein
MSFNADIKTLGFEQMHEDQVEAFLTLIDAALNLAAAVDDEEVFEQMHQVAEDAVILFGGVGIDIKFKADY